MRCARKYRRCVPTQVENPTWRRFSVPGNKMNDTTPHKRIRRAWKKRLGRQNASRVCVPRKLHPPCGFVSQKFVPAVDMGFTLWNNMEWRISWDLRRKITNTSCVACFRRTARNRWTCYSSIAIIRRLRFRLLFEKMFDVPGFEIFPNTKKKTGTSPGFVRTGGPLCPPPTLYISSSPVSLCNKNCLRTRSSEPKNFLPKPWLLPCAFMWTLHHAKDKAFSCFIVQTYQWHYKYHCQRYWTPQALFPDVPSVRFYLQKTMRKNDDSYAGLKTWYLSRQILCKISTTTGKYILLQITKKR